MNVTVIVTCFNERNNIRECLITLTGQVYHQGEVDILVVDGGSTDGTIEIIQELEHLHENIRLVIEPKKGTAAGRNAGVNNARYDHIAFIDADCEAPPDWLAILAEAYQRVTGSDPGIVAVGGTNIPPQMMGNFVTAIGIALDSYIGSFGSAQGRRFDCEVYVPSLANLNVLYHRGAIIKIGGYDESLVSEAEDADLNYRLFSAGGRFLFIPGSFVWHKMRPTPRTWYRNMFRYGKGRARLLKRHPAMWNVGFILPLLFLIGMAALFLAPFNPLFLLAALYFPFLVIFSIVQCVTRGGLQFVPHVVLVYLIQHFGYAFGELYGLISPKVR